MAHEYAHEIIHTPELWRLLPKETKEGHAEAGIMPLLVYTACLLLGMRVRKLLSIFSPIEHLKSEQIELRPTIGGSKFVRSLLRRKRAEEN